MLRNLLALLLCFAAASCTSKVDIALDDPVPIDGLYRSAATVGELGTLELIIRKRPQAVRVYNGELSGGQLGADATPGRGTLGNDHLIMNFDIGETDDFYFQGFLVQDTAGTVTGLSGSFIFAAGQAELPAEFTWISAPPEEEEEEEEEEEAES